MELGANAREYHAVLGIRRTSETITGVGKLPRRPARVVPGMRPTRESYAVRVLSGSILLVFVCICADIPYMRTPLQILFLILVTDLPPAIALGMEPGQPGIMKDRPRPKTQPVMLKWM